MAKRAKGAWMGRWKGGRIWRDTEGDPIYVIERQVRGKRYVRSTACSDVESALAHLARFQADPQAYDPRSVQREAPIYLDKELAEAFLGWSGLPKARGGKGNTKEWVRNQRAHLGWWGDQIAGVDLRGASLRDHILPPLEGAKSRAQRIAVLKALYSYLRAEKHLIGAADDPTLGTLRVPQSDPEQWGRPKDVAPEVFEKVAEELFTVRFEKDKLGRRIKKDGARWRSILMVLGGTGWHVTEARRFAASGSVEEQPGVAGQRPEPVLCCPRTKGGEAIRTRVSEPVAESARQLLRDGSFSISEFHRAIKASCARAKIKPPFAPGQMRHAVATWAIRRGADPATVAAYLNHQSPRTTRRFYAVYAASAKVPTLV